mmetsp:Transcript_13798/g.43685  ORF Transcript_13798/g.43685 Transcript_13798/m.43685 type:complete len:261 (+) Transcript_13798:80-862(+)
MAALGAAVKPYPRGSCRISTAARYQRSVSAVNCHAIHTPSSWFLTRSRAPVPRGAPPPSSHALRRARRARVLALAGGERSRNRESHVDDEGSDECEDDDDWVVRAEPDRRADDLPAGVAPPRVLAQAQGVIAVYKPPGVPFHGDDSGPGILQVLRSMQKAGELGYEGELHSVHRLDKVTSGIIVFGTSQDAAGELCGLFERREVTKYYCALSGRKPRKVMGSVVGDMAKSRRSAWKILRTKERPAVTRFETWRVNPPGAE